MGYLVKSIALSQVTGNFLTQPARDSNLASDERQLAVSGKAIDLTSIVGVVYGCIDAILILIVLGAEFTRG